MVAGYKVSYKVLRQQGEEIKAVAKLVDGYAERIAQISGKLGDGEMLSEVRGNLQKLRTQLGESRAVLNTSGDLLIKSVENYGGTETRQVKKVDGMKAHNRDFYKNPVVVASAGGAMGGAAVTGSVGVSSPAATAEQVVPTTQPMGTQTITSEPSVLNSAAPGAAETAAGTVAGTAGIAGAAGGAAAAGSVLGGIHLKKKRDAAKTAESPELPADNGYNPEDELKKAIQRVRDLEKNGG